MTSRLSLGESFATKNEDVKGVNPMHHQNVSLNSESARRVSHAMGIKDHSPEAENFDGHQGKIVMLFMF